MPLIFQIKGETRRVNLWRSLHSTRLNNHGCTRRKMLVLSLNNKIIIKSGFEFFLLHGYFNRYIVGI